MKIYNLTKGDFNMSKQVDPKDLIFKDAFEVRHYVQGAYAIIDGVEQRVGERNVLVSNPTKENGTPVEGREKLFYAKPLLPNLQGQVIPVYIPIEGVTSLLEAWDKYDAACEIYIEKLKEKKKKMEENMENMNKSQVMGEIKKEE